MGVHRSLVVEQLQQALFDDLEDYCAMATVHQRLRILHVTPHPQAPNDACVVGIAVLEAGIDAGVATFVGAEAGPRLAAVFESWREVV